MAMTRKRRRRAGRKRKVLAAREPNGQIQRRRDEGTRELQAKRRRLALDRDPALSAYPLGVLFARRLITEGMHVAGCEYAALYQAVFGRTSVAAGAWELRTGRSLAAFDENEERRLEHALFRAQASLDRLRRGARAAVESVVVHEHWPRCLRGQGSQIVAAQELALVQAGLARLQALNTQRQSA